MKIELHMHCSEISNCGRSSYVDMVARYKELGYDAIVMTDHYTRENAKEKCDRVAGGFMGYYDSIYRAARKEGEKIGLLVLKGYELRLDGSLNDYLIFGMHDSVARKSDMLLSSSNRGLFDLANDEDFLVYQAHPFRNDMKIVRPSLLHGIEVKNNSTTHDSRNDIAAMWAEKYSLKTISGSDAHSVSDAGTGGIIVFGRVFHALVKRHRNGGRQPRLDAHALLRPDKQPSAVNVGGKGHALLANATQLGK